MMVQIGKIIFQVIWNLTRESVPKWTTMRQFPNFMNLHRLPRSSIIGSWELLQHHVRSLYQNASPPHTVLAVFVGQWRTNWQHTAHSMRPIDKWLHHKNAADTTNFPSSVLLHSEYHWDQMDPSPSTIGRRSGRSHPDLGRSYPDLLRIGRTQLQRNLYRSTHRIIEGCTEGTWSITESKQRTNAQYSPIPSPEFAYGSYPDP